ELYRGDGWPARNHRSLSGPSGADHAVRDARSERRHAEVRSTFCGRIRRAAGRSSAPALEFDALDAFEPVQLGDQAGWRTLGPKTDPVGQVKRSTLLDRGGRG